MTPLRPSFEILSVKYTQTATIRQRQFANRSTGSRFAVNAVRYTGNLIIHLSFDGNAYQKSICKTLGKHSSSNYQGSFKMLSNRLDSTRVERLVSVKVDPSLARHLENILQVTSKSRWKCCRLESNDSSLLMSTCHTGSRFARHCENFP